MRSLHLPRWRSRKWLATVLAFAATAAGLAVTSSPASANSSEPIAIGIFRAGDMRVLHVSGDGVTNSSRVVAAAYIPGISGPDVGRQRWKLERLPASEGYPDYAYRIRNPATNKCLNKSGAVTGNSAPIILYTCENKKNEVWYTGIEPSANGIQLASYVDYRCLNVRGKNTADNAEVVSYDCGTNWNEYWKLRTGKFDCGVRTRDWTGTSQMCIQGSENFQGLVANWYNDPAQLAYRNPASYPLSNVVQRYAGITPINAQGVASGGVELGWQAQRTSSTNATAAYNAYWLETLPTSQHYYAVSAVDEFGASNGSTVADGRNHTYMLLGAGTSGQWEVYFDYNRVGTTAGQPGGRMRTSEVGQRVRYLDAATLPKTTQIRTQLMDANGVLRRPYYAETAVGTPKQCQMPPVYEDFGGGEGGNKPPWCLDASRSTFQQPDLPLQTGVFTVAKPTTSSVAAAVPPLPRLQPRTDSHNGVDQKALAACLQTNADHCLDTVSGLRACVLAHHQRCNSVTDSSGLYRRSDRIGLSEARERAKAQVRLAGTTTVKLATADTARTTTIGALRADVPDIQADWLPDIEEVHVLTGDDAVTGLSAAADKVFRGWTLVYLARAGSLIYASVGR